MCSSQILGTVLFLLNMSRFFENWGDREHIKWRKHLQDVSQIQWIADLTLDLDNYRCLRTKHCVLRMWKLFNQSWTTCGEFLTLQKRRCYSGFAWGHSFLGRNLSIFKSKLYTSGLKHSFSCKGWTTTSLLSSPVSEQMDPSRLTVIDRRWQMIHSHRSFFHFARLVELTGSFVEQWCLKEVTISSL